MTEHDFVQPADKGKNVLASFAEQRPSTKKLRQFIKVVVDATSLNFARTSDWVCLKLY